MMPSCKGKPAILALGDTFLTATHPMTAAPASNGCQLFFLGPEGPDCRAQLVENANLVAKLLLEGREID